MKSRSIWFSLVASILALVVYGFACGGRSDALVTVRPEPSPSPSPTVLPTPTTPVSRFLASFSDALDDWERKAMARAWSKVPHRENYEVAQSDYGEIAGAYGLALIVLNKSITSPERFSLIVFIRRPQNKYDLYWIYRNEDLSRVSLNRASGSIFVSRSGEDPTLNCRIAWSRKDNKWTCISL